MLRLTSLQNNPIQDSDSFEAKVFPPLSPPKKYSAASEYWDSSIVNL